MKYPAADFPGKGFFHVVLYILRAVMLADFMARLMFESKARKQTQPTIVTVFATPLSSKKDR